MNKLFRVLMKLVIIHKLELKKAKGDAMIHGD